MESRLEGLEIVYGELTPSRAVVQVRLRAGADEGFSLSGLVRGPRCRLGSTLPATYRLVPRGPFVPPVESHSQIECTTLITEPIFWSPDWPALYDVTVELRRAIEVVETVTRTIGLRPLAVVGKRLAYAGKNWVLRGIQRTVRVAEAVDECREQSAALVVPDQLLRQPIMTQASEIGVLVVAILSDQSHVAEEHLPWLSQYAAAAIAVLPPDDRPFRTGNIKMGNLLLARHLKQGDDEPAADESRLVLGEVSDAASFGDWARTLNRPVIAYREIWDNIHVATARAECDRLQRDLAPGGQYAGYIV